MQFPKRAEVRPSRLRASDGPSRAHVVRILKTVTAQLRHALAAPPTHDAASLLAEARGRTLLLVSVLTDEDAATQHDPLMSPVVWDLGHIARFEELWLTRNLEGHIAFGEMPGLFNPFEHPRRERGALDLPTLRTTFADLAQTRHRVLAQIDGMADDPSNPLLRGGYVFAMVAQHEYQHGETILQTMQLKGGTPYAAPRAYPIHEPRFAIEPGSMVRFPGGTVTIGTDDTSAAYDNERPLHRVEIKPFQIDRAPVTNGEYLAFMEDGGYMRRELWTPDGWNWLAESQVAAPKHWRREGSRWLVREMDREGNVDPRRPVVHVCWYESSAYARWAGKRLPTETEWEAAASWDPASVSARRFPWGEEAPTPAHANVDQLSFGTVPVGAYAANVSPIGCYGMIGDVWEWTSSDFTGYPGFRAFPYAEYSEVFFGSEYKVLRGGSWATRPGAIRNTFRNWDYPIRRQIFAGFRCARDD